MNCEGCKKELSKKLVKISTGECVNCNCEKEEPKTNKIEYPSPSICLKCQSLYLRHEVMIDFGVCKTCITVASLNDKYICHNCYKEVEDVGEVTGWCMDCKSKPYSVQKLAEGLYQCAECQQIVLELALNGLSNLCISCHKKKLFGEETKEVWKEIITISYEKITEVAADYVLASPHRCNGTWLKGFAEGLEFATKEAQNQIDRRK